MAVLELRRALDIDFDRRYAVVLPLSAHGKWHGEINPQKERYN
jgi:hypothetical protein